MASKVVTTNKSDDFLFKELKQQLLIEEIRSFLHFEKLDYALLKAIGLYNDEFSTDIGAIYIMEILNMYYTLRINHSVSDFVGKVKNSRTENLKQIRLLLKNIRTKDLAKIRYHFIGERVLSNTGLSDETTNYNRMKAAYDADLPNKDELKKAFILEYPNSKLK